MDDAVLAPLMLPDRTLSFPSVESRTADRSKLWLRDAPVLLTRLPRPNERRLERLSPRSLGAAPGAARDELRLLLGLTLAASSLPLRFLLALRARAPPPCAVIEEGSLGGRATAEADDLDADLAPCSEGSAPIVSPPFLVERPRPLRCCSSSSSSSSSSASLSSVVVLSR